MKKYKKNQKRKNKQNSINLAFSVFLILTIVIFSYFLIDNYFILGEREIFASFSVSDHSGFDLNKTALTFGLIKPGFTSSRTANITNNFEMPVLVIIKANGDLSEFLIVSENEFILSPNEEKKLSFSVFLPKDILIKDYKGHVTIIFKRILD